MPYPFLSVGCYSAHIAAQVITLIIIRLVIIDTRLSCSFLFSKTCPSSYLNFRLVLGLAFILILLFMLVSDTM